MALKNESCGTPYHGRPQTKSLRLLDLTHWYGSHILKLFGVILFKLMFQALSVILSTMEQLASAGQQIIG
jgi:hypothetical protein